MTALKTTWGTVSGHFGRRLNGLSKMMALSLCLHLFFFAFLIFNQLFWKFRTPALQGFQVNLVSPGPGFGGPGGGGGGRPIDSPQKKGPPGRGKTVSSGASRGPKKSPVVNPPREKDKGAADIPALASGKSRSIQSSSKPVSASSPPPKAQKLPAGPPVVEKDDPERLGEWWKKQTKALKRPLASPSSKVTAPQPPPKRTAKIDIERRQVIVPPLNPSIQGPQKQVPTGGSESIQGVSNGKSGISSDASELENSGAPSSSSEAFSPGDGAEGGGNASGEGGGDGFGMASSGPAGGTSIIGAGSFGSGGGGSGGGFGNGGGGGSGSGLGLAAFEFPGYLQKIDNKIRWQWAPPPVKSKADSLVLRFTIRKDGSIDKRSIVVEESSGHAFFDQAAIRAVHGAHPFPPLPDAYQEDLLTVYMNFVVQEAS
ncbi:MAG: energy transducer TonB [Nitrospiria bacterium]